MLLTSIFLILAVGILAFAVITQPFYEAGVEPGTSPVSTDHKAQEEAYQLRLLWLADLENDRITGKINQQEYERQKNRFQQEADQLLVEMSPDPEQDPQKQQGEVEGMIAQRRMQRVERSAGFCVKCGTALTVSDQFCPKCGEKLK